MGRAIDFPTSFSFPSGHATTAMLVFGWSRIYMGLHYLSDVIAGYLAGLLWATLVVLGIELISYFAIGHPEVAAEEKDVEKGVGPLREAVDPVDAEPRVGMDVEEDVPRYR